MQENLVIISGASGAVGEVFLTHFAGQPATSVIGIQRRPSKSGEALCIQVDLRDKAKTATEIKKLDLTGVKKLLFIHAVGQFKLEKNGIPEHDSDTDGIDDGVYESNVLTFENVMTPLLEKITNEKRNITVSCIAFGSVTDAYVIKYWQSFSRAKNILRKLLKYLTETGSLQKGIFVAVSTTETGNEAVLRPFSDKTFWLTPNEILEKTLPHIQKETPLFQEVSVIKPNPHFKEGYYENLEAIRTKWSRETGTELI